MRWRVMLELTGPDGTVSVHEVGGRAAVAEYAPQRVGLMLAEGRRVLGALQVRLIRAEVACCAKSRNKARNLCVSLIG
jgi:hypothetical protein